jgi:uncharacterized protein YcfJ
MANELDTVNVDTHSVETPSTAVPASVPPAGASGKSAPTATKPVVEIRSIEDIKPEILKDREATIKFTEEFNKSLGNLDHYLTSSDEVKVGDSLISRIERRLDSLNEVRSKLASGDNPHSADLYKYQEKTALDELKKLAREAKRGMAREEEYLKKAIDTVRKYDVKVQKGIGKTGRDIKRISKELATQMKELAKNNHETLPHAITVEGFTINQGERIEGSLSIDKIAEGIEKKMGKASDAVTNHFEKQITALEDRLEKLQGVRNDLINDGGEEIAKMFKSTESTVVKTLEKESNQIEHMAEDAAKGGSKLKGAAIGGVVGGIVGYAVGSDDNKPMAVATGATAGGIIGAIAQGWQSSKAALGGVMHGREAQKLLASAERSFTHAL